VVKLRTARPISLVAAFEEPCRTDPEIGGHMKQACERIADYIPEIEHAYGIPQDTPTWILRVGPNTRALSGLGVELPLPDLVTAIGDEVAQRQERS
jgi:hypothetical protein